MKLSIRNKLFIGTCLPIAIIYLIVLGIEYRIRSNAAIVSMQAYLKEIAEGEASEIDTKLSAVAQVCLTGAGILSCRHSDDADE